ncbi:hypothetical protein KJ359_001346 [Pestalotiopsis sp. 9143b]|nr:hypothetical protein KJ359_001346 [Pestalotiopsis sp. 9143b]
MGACGRLRYLFTRAGLALRTLFEDEEKDIMGSEEERSRILTSEMRSSRALVLLQTDIMILETRDKFWHP